MPNEDFNLDIGLNITPASLKAIQSDINAALRAINPEIQVKSEFLEELARDGLDLAVKLDVFPGSVKNLRKTIENALEIKINKLGVSKKARDRLEEELRKTAEQIQVLSNPKLQPSAGLQSAADVTPSDVGSRDAELKAAQDKLVALTLEHTNQTAKINKITEQIEGVQDKYIKSLQDRNEKSAAATQKTLDSLRDEYLNNQAAISKFRALDIKEETSRRELVQKLENAQDEYIESLKARARKTAEDNARLDIAQDNYIKKLEERAADQREQNAKLDISLDKYIETLRARATKEKETSAAQDIKLDEYIKNLKDRNARINRELIEAQRRADFNAAKLDLAQDEYIKELEDKAKKEKENSAKLDIAQDQYIQRLKARNARINRQLIDLQDKVDNDAINEKKKEIAGARAANVIIDKANREIAAAKQALANAVKQQISTGNFTFSTEGFSLDKLVRSGANALSNSLIDVGQFLIAGAGRTEKTLVNAATSLGKFVGAIDSTSNEARNLKLKELREKNSNLTATLEDYKQQAQKASEAVSKIALSGGSPGFLLDLTGEKQLADAKKEEARIRGRMNAVLDRISNTRTEIAKLEQANRDELARQNGKSIITDEIPRIATQGFDALKSAVSNFANALSGPSKEVRDLRAADLSKRLNALGKETDGLKDRYKAAKDNAGRLVASVGGFTNQLGETQKSLLKGFNSDQASLQKQINKNLDEERQLRAELVGIQKKNLAQARIAAQKRVQADIGQRAQVQQGNSDTVTFNGVKDITNFGKRLDPSSMARFVDLLKQFPPGMERAFGSTVKFSDSVKKSTSFTDKLRDSMDSGKKAAFEFGEQAATAASRFLAWAGPATLIFTTISRLKEAVNEVKNLDIQARRLTFFEAVGDRADPLSGISKNSKSSLKDFSLGISEVQKNVQFFIDTSQKTGIALNDIVNATLTASRVGQEFSKTIQAEDGSTKKVSSAFLDTVLSLVRLEGGALNAEDAVNTLNAIQKQFFSSLLPNLEKLNGKASALDTFNQSTATAGALLAKVAADSAFSVSELADATSRVGAAFSNIQGTGLPQVISLIGQASSITGANVGRLSTALRQVLTFSVQNADKIKKQFNIDVIDESGGIKGFESVLAILRKINELSGTERAVDLAKLIGDRRNVADIESLAAAVGTLEKNYGNLSSEAAEVKLVQEAVLAQEKGNILTSDSLQASTERLNTAFTNLANSSGAAEAIKLISNQATTALTSFKGLFDAISQGGPVLKSLAAFFATFAIGKLAPQIGAGIAGFVSGAAKKASKQAVKQEVLNSLGSEENIIKAINNAEKEGFLLQGESVLLREKVLHLVELERGSKASIFKLEAQKAAELKKSVPDVEKIANFEKEISRQKDRQIDLELELGNLRGKAINQAINSSEKNRVIDKNLIPAIGGALAIGATLFAEPISKGISEGIKNPTVGKTLEFTFDHAMAAVVAGLGAKFGNARFGKVGGAFGAAIGAAFGAGIDIGIEKLGSGQTGRKITGTLFDPRVISAGISGGVTGALVGAQLGSVVPVLGTALGGVIGAAIGFAFGSNNAFINDIIGELDEKAANLEAKRKSLLAGAAQKDIIEARKVLQAQNADKRALVQEQINSLTQEQGDLLRKIQSDNLDFTQVQEARVRLVEIENQKYQLNLDIEEETLRVEKQRLGTQDQINDLKRKETAFLEDLAGLKDISTQLLGGTQKINVEIEFDKVETERKLKAITDKIQVLKDKQTILFETRGSFSEISQVSQEILDAEAEAVSIRRAATIADSKKQLAVVDELTKKFNEQLSGFGEAAKTVSTSISSVVSAQIDGADKILSNAISISNIFKSQAEYIAKILDESGASAADKLNATRDAISRRLQEVSSAGKAAISKLNSGVATPFGSTAELKSSAEKVAELISAAGIHAQEKIFDEDTKIINQRLILLRNEADEAKTLFDLRINLTKKEIEIRQKINDEELAGLRQRQEAERAFAAERDSKQREFGRLIIEGPQRFLEAARDITTATKFFNGIKDLNIGSLRQISNRASNNRRANNFEGLQSVARGLETAQRLGRPDIISGISNSQLQSIFEKIQISTPEELDAQLKAQTAQILGQTNIQKEIELRERRQVALLEAESAIQSEQLKIDTAAQEAAIKQRTAMIELLKESIMSQNAGLSKLISINSQAQIELGASSNRNQGGVGIANDLRNAVDAANEAAKTSVSNAVAPSSSIVLNNSLNEASAASKNFADSIRNVTIATEALNKAQNLTLEDLATGRGTPSVEANSNGAIKKLEEILRVNSQGGFSVGKSQERLALEQQIRNNGGTAADRSRLEELKKTEARPQNFGAGQFGDTARTLLGDKEIKSGLESGLRTLFQDINGNDSELVQTLKELRGTGARGERAINVDVVREVLGRFGLSGVGRSVDTKGEAADLIDKLVKFSDELNRVPDRLTDSAARTVASILSTELKENFKELSDIIAQRNGRFGGGAEAQGVAANGGRVNLFNEGDVESFSDKFSEKAAQKFEETFAGITDRLKTEIGDIIVTSLRAGELKIEVPKLEFAVNGAVQNTINGDGFLAELQEVLLKNGLSAEQVEALRARMAQIVQVMINNGQIPPG